MVVVLPTGREPDASRSGGSDPGEGVGEVSGGLLLGAGGRGTGQAQRVGD